MAIRDEWLVPGLLETQEALREAAAVVTVSGGMAQAGDIFPRVYSTRLEVTEVRPDHKGPEKGARSRQEAPPEASSLPEAGRGPRYLLVLDLEGKDEITEFPVIILDSVLKKEIGRFQRYVRPVSLFDGCAITPDSPAISFQDTLYEFEAWLGGMVPGLSLAGVDGVNASFLCCGDWDCRHIATQCRISGIDLPPCFHTWVNVKKSFSASYGGVEIKGMRSMLSRLRLLRNNGHVKHGFHHLGMHDTENIGRCVLNLWERGYDITVNGGQPDRQKKKHVN